MYFFSVYLIHDTVDTVECLQKKMCSLWNWFINYVLKILPSSGKAWK